MVAPNFGSPVPVHVINPLVAVLVGMSQTISLLNDLDFALAKDLETERRAVVAALLQNHEAVANLANSWELAAAKKLAGDGN